MAWFQGDTQWTEEDRPMTTTNRRGLSFRGQWKNGTMGAQFFSPFYGQLASFRALISRGDGRSEPSELPDRFGVPEIALDFQILRRSPTEFVFTIDLGPLPF